MLHANELMIGDWVNIYVFPNDEPKGDALFPARINEILSNSEDVECKYDINGKGKVGYASRPAGTCLPIPLTPEILEKNGWKHDPSMERLIIDCKLFIDRERWMSWDSKYHCLNITIRDSKQLSQYNLKELRLDVPCTNVHELQHALRLCGIEKEITL